MSYDNPRFLRLSHFSFILLSSTSYSTDYQLCAIRTPFRCQRVTPPPPERSPYLWIKKKFWPIIKTRLKGQNLIIVMLKRFRSTDYGSSLEGEVFQVDTEKVFWRHIISGLLTATRGTTQQYKRKIWWSWKSRVVIAKELVTLGSNPRATTKIFSHFSFAFFQTPLGEKVSIQLNIVWNFINFDVNIVPLPVIGTGVMERLIFFQWFSYSGLK